MRKLTRIEALKIFWRLEKWKILLLVAITATLPLMTNWHNPAGAQPVVVFGGICLIGWLGLALWFCSIMANPTAAINAWISST